MSRELCLIGLVGLGIPRLDRSRQQTKLNCRDHTIEHSTICMSERAYNRKRKGTDLQQSSAGVMSQKDISRSEDRPCLSSPACRSGSAASVGCGWPHLLISALAELANDKSPPSHDAAARAACGARESDELMSPLK